LGSRSGNLGLQANQVNVTSSLRPNTYPSQTCHHANEIPCQRGKYCAPVKTSLNSTMLQARPSCLVLVDKDFFRQQSFIVCHALEYDLSPHIDNKVNSLFLQDRLQALDKLLR